MLFGLLLCSWMVTACLLIWKRNDLKNFSSVGYVVADIGE